MLKLILFILFIWFIIRVIARLFFYPANLHKNSFFGGKSNSNPSSGRQQSTGNTHNKNLEQIEEAEFEDITEEQSEQSKNKTS